VRSEKVVRSEELFCFEVDGELLSAAEGATECDG
jgi:hypothetical protein